MHTYSLVRLKMSSMSSQPQQPQHLEPLPEIYRSWGLTIFEIQGYFELFESWGMEVGVFTTLPDHLQHYILVDFLDYYSCIE